MNSNAAYIQRPCQETYLGNICYTIPAISSPVEFNPGKSQGVAQTGTPGEVFATNPDDSDTVAIYDGPYNEVIVDYTGGPTSVVISFETAQTGFINTAFQLFATNCFSDHTGPYTFNLLGGIELELERISPAGLWGEEEVVGINPIGSLCLNANDPVLRFRFGTPITNFGMRGWGNGAAGDIITVSATPSTSGEASAYLDCDGAIKYYRDVDGAELSNVDIVTCDCCGSGGIPRALELIGPSAINAFNGIRSGTAICRTVGNLATPPVFTDGFGATFSLFEGDIISFGGGKILTSGFGVQTFDAGDFVTVIYT